VLLRLIKVMDKKVEVVLSEIEMILLEAIKLIKSSDK